MNSEKEYIVTLDDGKKYAIVNSITFNDKKYVYLSELEDFSKYIIGELINNEIVEIDNNNLLDQLIMEFAKMN